MNVSQIWDSFMIKRLENLVSYFNASFEKKTLNDLTVYDHPYTIAAHAIIKRFINDPSKTLWISNALDELDKIPLSLYELRVLYG